MGQWLRMVVVYRTASGEIRRAEAGPAEVIATWLFILVALWTLLG
jgi:hypothetical protein